MWQTGKNTEHINGAKTIPIGNLKGKHMSDVKPTPQQIQMSPDSLNKANNSMNYTMNLVNMSLQQLWNIAYAAGFEDAQEIMKTDKGQK